MKNARLIFHLAFIAALPPLASAQIDITSPFSTSVQGAITGGTLNFRAPDGSLNANSAPGVTGGVQNFFDSTVLRVQAAGALSGGEQSFFDTSELRILENGAGGLTGGVQHFYNDSTLYTFALDAVGGGEQFFHDMSRFFALHSTSASGTTLHFSEDARLEIQAADALSRTTDLVFDGTTPGSIGGFMNLSGNDVTIGRLSSIAGGGVISNFVGGAVANLIVDFDTGTSVWAGRIEDDGGNAGLNFAKRGEGTQVFASAQTYIGGTSIEGGTLRLDFSAATAPVQNIVHLDAAQLGLAGGRLELVGKVGANNRQSFSSVGLTKASRVALTPNGASSLELHLGDYGNFQRERSATVDFTIPTGSAVKFSNVTGAPTLPWATMTDGAAFATLTLDGMSGNHVVTALTTHESTVGGVGVSPTAGLVQFQEPAAHTFTNGSALSNPAQFRGILVNPEVGSNLSRMNYGAILPDYAPPDDPTKVLFVHQYNTAGSLELSLDFIYNTNGPSPGLEAGFTLVKTGPGTLIYEARASRNIIVLQPTDPRVRLVIEGGTVITDDDIIGDVQLGDRSGPRIPDKYVLSGEASISGKLVIGPAGVVAPGHSPGTLTAGSEEWQGGGTYKWELNDALGTVGTDPGWDLLSVAGLLEITATAGDRFTLDLRSLTLANLSGDPANFDPLQNYAWTIASAGGGVSGFDEDAFDLVRSGFTSSADGAFGVALSGNDVQVTYTPAPEPTSALLLLAGATLLAGRRRR